MSDFVNFKLAQKLKEKGFDCKYPFAMYDEDGDFYPLFTSCDEDEDSKCIFGKRMYYGYDDFIGDKDAVITPALLDARNTVMWYALQKGLSIKQIAHLMGKCLASVYYGIHSFETISRVDKFYSLKKQRIDKKLRIK